MFFTSSLHDPDAPWRSEPATERQLEKLDDLGIRRRPGMTKGEAADLLGRGMEPDEDELEFLRFFKVPDLDEFNQLEARQEIARIVADDANRQRWENRPATAEQRRLIAHVEGVLPRGLTAERAKQIISSYDDSEDQAAKVEDFRENEAAREEREAHIEWLTEDIKESRGEFGLRSVSRRDVRQAAEELELETDTALEDLIPFDVAERIRRNSPEKATPKAKPRPAAVTKKSGATVGQVLGVILLLLVLYNMLIA